MSTIRDNLGNQVKLGEVFHGATGPKQAAQFKRFAWLWYIIDLMGFRISGW